MRAGISGFEESEKKDGKVIVGDFPLDYYIDIEN